VFIYCVQGEREWNVVESTPHIGAKTRKKRRRVDDCGGEEGLSQGMATIKNGSLPGHHHHHHHPSSFGGGGVTVLS
jgi:hypothetical protein